MRLRLGGLLAFATLLTGVASACNTAGVAYVYMSIDSAGMQPRQTFYTDSSEIFCVAVVSSGRPDVTVDVVVHQTAVFDWCSDPTHADTNPAFVHPVFGVGEDTPGVSMDSPVSFQLDPNGIQVDVMCNGYCTQNQPVGNLCGPNGMQTTQFTGASCRTQYASAGADSCGPGLTCCVSEVPGTTASATGFVAVPFPAGVYTCDVFLDGVPAGSAPFTVEYPIPGAAGGELYDAGADSCPVPPPVDGIPCYNWVPFGTKCLGFNPDSTCTCAETGVWTCN